MHKQRQKYIHPWKNGDLLLSSLVPVGASRSSCASISQCCKSLAHKSWRKQTSFSNWISQLTRSRIATEGVTTWSAKDKRPRWLPRRLPPKLDASPLLLGRLRPRALIRGWISYFRLPRGLPPRPENKRVNSPEFVDASNHLTLFSEAVILESPSNHRLSSPWYE